MVATVPPPLCTPGKSVLYVLIFVVSCLLYHLSSIDNSSRLGRTGAADQSNPDLRTGNVWVSACPVFLVVCVCGPTHSFGRRTRERSSCNVAVLMLDVS